MACRAILACVIDNNLVRVVYVFLAVTAWITAILIASPQGNTLIPHAPKAGYKVSQSVSTNMWKCIDLLADLEDGAETIIYIVCC